MKFLVSDIQAERHTKIRALLSEGSAPTAVLLAAVDLEWTIRRILDAANDTQDVSNDQIAGLERYRAEWQRICVRKQGMAEIDKIIQDWNELRKAFQLRHDIVHGRNVTVGHDYARKRVDLILMASIQLAEVGRAYGFDPYKRLKRRRLTGPTKVAPRYG